MDQNNKTAKIYLGLGTNLGNREFNIQQAIVMLSQRVGIILAISSTYETKPEGFDSDNYFLNAACQIATELSPLEVLAVTQQIELEMGRTTKSSDTGYTDRIIDIDLLLFEDQIIDLPNLQIPHPEISQRLFVLDPLVEIAPHVSHPTLNITLQQLKNSLNEPS